MTRDAITLLCEWTGPDLFDTEEPDGETIGIRAMLRVSWEFVSLLRKHFSPKRPHREGPGPMIDEPMDHDLGVMFWFPWHGLRIQSEVTIIAPDNRPLYAITFSLARRWFQRAPALPDGFERMIEAALDGSRLIKALKWMSPSEIPC